jgi:hypothetical protein
MAGMARIRGTGLNRLTAGVAVLLAAVVAVGACDASPLPAPASAGAASAAGTEAPTAPPVSPGASPVASAGASQVVPGGSAGASASPAAPVSPSASPPASPSPAIAPGDAFVAVVTDPAFAATATLAGGRAIGKVRTTTTGTLELSGSSWHLVRTATTGSARSTAEAIAVGGTRYVKAGAEWFEGDDAAGAGLVAAVLGRSGAIVDAGPETVDGGTLHRLSIDAPRELASALGLAGAGISGVAGTVDAWVHDDGTPVRARLAATWKQKVSGKATKSSAHLELAFSGIGQPVAVAQPAGTWAWFTSGRYGYRIGHPADWESAPGAKGYLDAIYSPAGPTVFANRFKSYGFGLARVIKELRADPSGFTGFTKARILSSASTRLGPLAARRVVMSGTYKSTRYWWIVYVAVKGAWVHWVEYRTTAAPTPDDLAMAARIAATHRVR